VTKGIKDDDKPSITNKEKLNEGIEKQLMICPPYEIILQIHLYYEPYYQKEYVSSPLSVV